VFSTLVGLQTRLRAMSEATFNPSKRRLCPDGACIGVVGDDGRCRVCGRANDGTVATPAHTYADAGADADPIGDGDDEHERDAAANDLDLAGGDGGTRYGLAAAGAGAGFRPDRRLCDDGSCIGVIGADGVCSVCGRAGGA
jgi:hypothetical protein